jgi:hypothetical protein
MIRWLIAPVCFAKRLTALGANWMRVDDCQTISHSDNVVVSARVATRFHCAENAKLRHPLQGRPTLTAPPNRFHGHELVALDEALAADDADFLRPDLCPGPPPRHL